jgi:hypothetical protein
MGRTRHQSTYGELFQTHLEQEIERGARVYRMTTLIAMYQGRDDGERHNEFVSWLESTGAFPCGRCGEVFSLKEPRQEDEQVLCWTCRFRS